MTDKTFQVDSRFLRPLGNPKAELLAHYIAVGAGQIRDADNAKTFEKLPPEPQVACRMMATEYAEILGVDWMQESTQSSDYQRGYEDGYQDGYFAGSDDWDDDWDE